MVQRFATSVNSGLSEGANVLLSKIMDRVGEAANNLSITIPGSSTRNARFYTPSGMPNNEQFQSATDSCTIKIITGFSNVRMAVEIARVPDAGGTANETGCALTAEQTPVSGATLTFSLPCTWTRNAGVLTERLRWHVAFRTTNATARTVVFEVGQTDTSLLSSVTDDVQATGAGAGGAGEAAPAATLARLTAAVLAAGRPSGDARATAVLAGLCRAGGAAGAVPTSRATSAAAGLAGARAGATTASLAALSGLGPAGGRGRGLGTATAVLLGTGRGGALSAGPMLALATLTGSGVAGAREQSAMNAVMAMLGSARAGARGAGLSSNKAVLLGRGRSAAAGRIGVASMQAYGAGGATHAVTLQGLAAMTAAARAGSVGSGDVTFTVAAVLGCIARAAQTMRVRWANEIPGIATIYDAEGETPETAGEWVRFAIQWAPSRPFIIGTEKRHRHPGSIDVQVRTPLEAGDGRAREIADDVTLAFREIDDGDVTFHTPFISSQNRDSGDDFGGAWWRVDVTIPFTVDC